MVLPREFILNSLDLWKGARSLDPFAEQLSRRPPEGELKTVGGPFGRLLNIPVQIPVVRTELDPPFYMFTRDPRSEGWGGVSFELHRRGKFEDAIAERISQEVSDICRSSGGLFIDVGTNIGFFTMLAASWGCRVLGFEANSALHELVRNSAMLNGFHHVTVVPHGAGPKRERVLVNNKRTCPGCSSLTSADDPDAMEIMLVDISSYVEERPVFMKIDIDGYEIGALEGALDFIRKYKLPRGYVELNPWWWHRGRGVTLERGQQLLQELNSIGYEFSHTNGSRYSFESLISDVKSTIVDSPYEGVDTNLFFSLPTTYQGMA